jgi:hypothetical protein
MKLTGREKDIVERFGALFTNHGGNDIVDLIEREGVTYFSNPVVAEMQGACFAQVRLLTQLLDREMISLRRPLREIEPMPYYDQTQTPDEAWEQTWKEIVCNADGTINADLVKLELSDFSMLLRYYAVVLQHATGGRISKENTHPSAIMAVIDDYISERVAEAVEEELEIRADVATAEAQAGGTPCPSAGYMGEHACKNAAQCFEPCGQLGHSEEHVRVGTADTRKVSPPYGDATLPTIDWQFAQQVCDAPYVDESIRNLLEDHTGDNATFMVRAVLEIAASMKGTTT